MTHIKLRRPDLSQVYRNFTYKLNLYDSVAKAIVTFIFGYSDFDKYSNETFSKKFVYQPKCTPKSFPIKWQSISLCRDK